MKKWRKGYKIVRRSGSRFVSCIMWRRRGNIYNIGHITKRRQGCGALAVFSNKRYARKFFKQEFPEETGLFVIKPCKYTASTDMQYWITSAYSIILCMNDPPEGSRFADEVELVEEVR